MLVRCFASSVEPHNGGRYCLQRIRNKRRPATRHATAEVVSVETLAQLAARLITRNASTSDTPANKKTAVRRLLAIDRNSRFRPPKAVRNTWEASERKRQLRE